MHDRRKNRPLHTSLRLALLTVVSIVCSYLLAPVHILGQVDRLTGEVVDELDEPVPHIEVRLESVPSRTTSTDAFGRFEFFGVGRGRHRIAVEATGYQHATIATDTFTPTRIVLRSFRRSRPDPIPHSHVIDVSQFLENFPDQATTHYRKGVESSRQGRREEAIEHLKKAVLLAPRFFDAHVNLALLYHGNNWFEEAEEEYLVALSLSRGHPQPLINLGDLYLTQGRNREAIGILRDAIRITPPPLAAFKNLGIALFRTNQLEEAERMLLRARDLDPENSSTRLMLANVYLRMGEAERLLEQLDAYLQEHPDGDGREWAARLRAELLKTFVNLRRR